MKLHYYPETDTLSIGLTQSNSSQTQEIAPDVTVDFDAEGNVVSIDIDLASKKLNLAVEAVGLFVNARMNFTAFYEELIAAEGMELVSKLHDRVGDRAQIEKRVPIEIIRIASSELERESQGAIALIAELPGVLVYGQTEEEAIARAKILVSTVLLDRVEHRVAEGD